MKKNQERTSNDGEIAIEADRQEERESDQSSVEHGTLKPSCSSSSLHLMKKEFEYQMSRLPLSFGL